MLKNIFLTMIFAITLQGCVSVALTGATTVGYSIAQERSVGNAIDDTTILTQISSSYLQKDSDNLFGKISVEVHEGRVLLTGTVNNADERIEAVRLAWNPVGVKEVINEIRILEKTNTAEYAKDVWITAQVKTRLLFEKKLHSINYTVDTVGGTVYLFGIGQNKQEVEKATHLAGIVKGVTKVVSHVRLKNDALRK